MSLYKDKLSRQPLRLHPTPDTATAQVIQKINDEPGTRQDTEEGLNRAKTNYKALISGTGVNEDTPYMLKALYRRALLLDAAHIRIMERLACETDTSSIKKLTASAQDLHKDYMVTVGAIYKLENDPDPVLVQGDFDVIDNPRPQNAVRVLGTRGVVEVEMQGEGKPLVQDELG